MILNFKPDKYCKNVFAINYEKLKEQGIELIACDLDNTLVPHDILEASTEVKDLFIKIKDLGFNLVVLSNNKQKRVERFLKNMDVSFYYSARKPLKKTFVKLLEDFSITPDKVCLIGDQVMTDVYGANRMGITSILVEPLAQRDIFYTKFNRIAERSIIKKLEKKKLFKVGEYYE